MTGMRGEVGIGGNSKMFNLVNESIGEIRMSLSPLIGKLSIIENI